MDVYEPIWEEDVTYDAAWRSYGLYTTFEKAAAVAKEIISKTLGKASEYQILVRHIDPILGKYHAEPITRMSIDGEILYTTT